MAIIESRADETAPEFDANRAQFNALLAELRIAAQIQPQPEVHIRGDANVRYQYVGQVLVLTQQIGIRKVAFITTPDHFGPGT